MIVLSTAVFFIGLLGVLIRRNMITMLMGVELMLNAVNINFVAFNHYLYPNLEGHFFALIVMAIAAAEAAVAIALIINIYRRFATVGVDHVDELKY